MDSTQRPEDLRGKRYIAYARCASQRGSTQSLRRQIRLVRRFGDRMGMRCIDEVRHPGVGGLVPLLRRDLRVLLARKRTQNDFDLLVMENAARLTRADGAGRLEALFMLCGVQIIYAAKGRADGMAVRSRSARPRESIIRDLAQRHAQGLPLTVGGQGVSASLYAVACRTFGSWRNAIQAAGILPQQVLTWERWSPPRILVMIRHLAARERQLTNDEMDRRYHNLASAARRHFGSWTKAVLAAGVNPARLQKVVLWNRERVIENILTRALRSESLVARFVEPRSLVAAAQRFFGGWRPAVAAAGLDPALTVPAPKRSDASRPARTRTSSRDAARQTYARWSKEEVTAALQARLRDGKPVHSTAIAREDSRLYDAMRRCFGSYKQAMHGAGLDPEAHRRGPPAPTALPDGAPDAAARFAISRQSQANEALRPDRPA